MAISNAIKDREFDRFTENSDGNTAVRVVIGRTSDNETSLIGTTPSAPVYKNITGNSWTLIVALRIKSTSPNSQLILNNILGTEESGRDVAFDIIKNPTLTGASWLDTGTIAEYDISATFTGGSILNRVVSKNDFLYPVKGIRINSDDLGNSDIILIAARALKQNNTAYAVINYEVIT